MNNKMLICTILVYASSLVFSGNPNPREPQADEKPLVSKTLAASDESETVDWKKLITSDAERDRINAKDLLLNDRRETIRCLLLVLNRAVDEGEEFYNSTTSRNIAISLLGSLCAKEAVGDLSKWLVPKPGQRMIIDELPMFSPAGYALIEIGLPSVPTLVEVLKSQDSVAVRDECIKIIVSIKGVAETEILLNNVLSKEIEGAKKERLKAALAVCKDRQSRQRLEKIYKKVNQIE